MGKGDIERAILKILLLRCPLGNRLHLHRSQSPLLIKLWKNYEQAVGWLDSLGPLYKIMVRELLPLEVWEQVLVYPKVLYDDISRTPGIREFI